MFTKECIKEYNTVIAKFMGFYKGRWGYYTEHNDLKFYSPKYHNSWDWLMPVVDKINKETDCYVTIYHGKCKIHHLYTECMPDVIIEDESTIISVYKAVLIFIDWYNENKK